MFMKKVNHQIKHIIYKNISITVKIKKYRYSKNYKVTYDKKCLQALVTIPKYIAFKSGHQFAIDNIDWIYRQHIEMVPSIIIEHGNLININGKEKNLIFKNDTIDSVTLDNKNIIISSKKASKHGLVFFNWIKIKITELTKSILLEKFQNKNIKKIRISNSFSYWGSCNTKDSISIDWRLIFAPDHVLKYIIIHELCHLTEFNHGSQFWSLVDSKIDNRNFSQAWLKQNANYLYRIRFS
jgi:predicted metal-dependent hydrolase